MMLIPALLTQTSSRGSPSRYVVKRESDAGSAKLACTYSERSGAQGFQRPDWRALNDLAAPNAILHVHRATMRFPPALLRRLRGVAVHVDIEVRSAELRDSVGCVRRHRAEPLERGGHYGVPFLEPV